MYLPSNSSTKRDQDQSSPHLKLAQGLTSSRAKRKITLTMGPNTHRGGDCTPANQAEYSGRQQSAATDQPLPTVPAATALYGSAARDRKSCPFVLTCSLLYSSEHYHVLNSRVIPASPSRLVLMLVLSLHTVFFLSVCLIIFS